MIKRTSEEINAYLDGYNDSFETFLNYYLEKESKESAIAKMRDTVTALNNALRREDDESGEWVKVNPSVDSVECSVCKYQLQSEELATPFCPWCGTKMKTWSDE